MNKPPLMRKATAVWLIDNTRLTFQQIADYCHVHMLEIQNIADGELAQNIIGVDPIATGQLLKEELEKAQKNPHYKMNIAKSNTDIKITKKRKKPKYTPLAIRHNRPDAIAWILQNYTEMPDSYIIKLLGTTKNTIKAIKEKTHWNISNIKFVDPVALGLCSQIDLDEAVAKTQKKIEKEMEKKEQK